MSTKNWVLQNAYTWTEKTCKDAQNITFTTTLVIKISPHIYDDPGGIIKVPVHILVPYYIELWSMAFLLNNSTAILTDTIYMQLRLTLDGL